MFDLYTVSMLLFVGLLVLFFWADRKNVERQSFLLLRKTTKGKAFLTWLGQRFPRIWWVYGSLAVGAGFLASVFISYFLISMVSTSLTTDTGAPIALVLPSPTSEAVVVPGVLGVPFWFWIISIFMLILVHEGSHGLMAAREKVRIKTLGWGLMIAIPLAFVEPDEEQLKKEKPMKQLRVFAAGSFGNFLLAIVAINIFSFLVVSNFAPVGVSFNALIADGPAANENMTGTIVRINDYDIKTIADLSVALEEIGAGERIDITTQIYSDHGIENRTFTLTTVEHPDFPGSGRGFIGIETLDIHLALKDGAQYPDAINFLVGKRPSLFYPTMQGLLFFLYLINLGVGMFNLLPLGPLDGGRMWKIVFDKLIPKQSRVVMNGISWVFLMVVLMLFASAFI